MKIAVVLSVEVSEIKVHKDKKATRGIKVIEVMMVEV